MKTKRFSFRMPLTGNIAQLKNYSPSKRISIIQAILEKRLVDRDWNIDDLNRLSFIDNGNSEKIVVKHSFLKAGVADMLNILKEKSMSQHHFSNLVKAIIADGLGGGGESKGANLDHQAVKTAPLPLVRPLS